MRFLFHPLVVHFPVALWLTSFLFDLVHARTGESFYATASRYLIGLGLLGAAVAIVTGFVDYVPLVAEGVGAAFINQHRTHSILAYTSAVVYGMIFVVRWRGRGRAASRGRYLAMAAVGAALIAATGYLGGELRRVM